MNENKIVEGAYREKFQTKIVSELGFYDLYSVMKLLFTNEMEKLNDELSKQGGTTI